MFCLKVTSDAEWAAEAARSLDDVLVDHAHCEMKAASNALSLALRHPDDLGLVVALSDLAREEIEHFQRVVGFIQQRGLALGTPPVDTYAARLRSSVAKLPHSRLARVGLVDRLLVGAVIEARSCERFKLLLARAEVLADVELHAFYTELFACEARHYRTFVDLAVAAADGATSVVDARLEILSALEGEIVTSLASEEKRERRASIHG
jgi:tRNA-(ms[2]io[6]A)-hydroxylase